MPYFLECESNIVFTGNSNSADDISSYMCSAGWSIVEGTSTFDPATDLDPVLIAGAVGAGAFVLVPIWAALLGGRFLMRAIASNF